MFGVLWLTVVLLPITGIKEVRDNSVDFYRSYLPKYDMRFIPLSRFLEAPYLERHSQRLG